MPSFQLVLKLSVNGIIYKHTCFLLNFSVQKVIFMVIFQNFSIIHIYNKQVCLAYVCVCIITHIIYIYIFIICNFYKDFRFETIP